MEEKQLFNLNDEKNFKKVFDFFHPKVYFYFVKNGCDTSTAQDLTQETFIKLYNYKSTLNQELKFSTQLFQIAKTTMYSHFRKQKIQTVELNHMDWEDALEDRTYRYELVAIQQATSALPQKCNEIFTLSKFNGLTNQEIAQSLKISIKTVESQMTRAVKILREKVSKIK